MRGKSKKSNNNGGASKPASPPVTFDDFDPDPVEPEVPRESSIEADFDTPPPTPHLLGTDNPGRGRWAQKVRDAGEWAMKVMGMPDDPEFIDALIIGLIGYETPDGLPANAKYEGHYGD